MGNESRPIVTSVVVPGKETPGLREPMVISAQENATEIAIRDALLAEPRLGGASLHLELHCDSLVISGAIETDEQRILVLDIAGQCVEGERLVDEMEIADQSPDFCEF